NTRGVFIVSGSDNVVGGTVSAERNVLSGNLIGVHIGIDGHHNQVSGNFIGTDASGARPLGNMEHGVLIEGPSNLVGGTTPGSGNVIAANGFDGLNGEEAGVAVVRNSAWGNLIQGNLIGTDVSGTTAIGNRSRGVFVNGASGTLIGGPQPGARNVIS